MKINHLLYKDELEVYAKNRKELESIMDMVKISSEDIGTEFGSQKCAILVMRQGKWVETTNIVTPNVGEIKAMGKD